jgi:hypothetical protein
LWRVLDVYLFFPLNIRNLKFNQENFVSGEMHKIWESSYDIIGGPVTRWPTDEELKSRYKLLSRSIEQGTKQMKEKFQEATR